MSWITVKLAEVCEIERKGIDPSEIESATKYLGLEHIETGGRIIGRQTVSNGELASTKFHFGPNHILYGKLRPYLGKIALPDFEGVCSTDILPIMPGPKVDRTFLAHFLRQPAMVEYATTRSTGANLPRLSPNALAEFELPLPSLDEQRHIASVLNKGDELRCLRQNSFERLYNLAGSIFHEMFGDVASNDRRWPDDKKLGDVAEIVSGITKGRKLNGKKTRSVSYLAVINVQDRELQLDPIKTIEATEEEISRYKLIKNDLLLTEGGDPDKVGRGTLWNEELDECIHQNHVFRVRLLDQDIDPVFLNWLVGSARGKRYFLRSAKRTTGIASINMTQLRGFPLVLPPKAQQKEFAKRVVKIDAHRDAYVKHLEELNALFSSLQCLAFRGEL